MFGIPVSRSELSKGPSYYNVMQVVWSYLIQLHIQTKKARVCGNGWNLRPEKKSLHKMYAAFTSMTGLRLLIGLAAYENWFLMASDAINAYAQSGPLEKKTYRV